MKHGTLVVPVDRAREFIDLIGKNTKMQFEDMNARDMHRPYKKYIQRIDEMERIIRFLLEELTKVPGASPVKHNVDAFLDHSDDYKLDDVEAQLHKIHKEFIQFKENNGKLLERRNAALEERYVVQTAMASMAHVASSRAVRSPEDRFEFEASRSLLDEEGGGTSRRSLETMFSNIAGVIHQEEQDRFARMLFRATRGNTFTHFQQIFEPMRDPKTGREVHKSVFVIYFQDHRIGSSVSAMSEKINKICNSFGVNTYRWPSSRTAAQEMNEHLKVQVEDQERLLKAHEHFVKSEAASLLEPVDRNRDSLIEEWRLFCIKEKSIYATLNLFEGNMNLRASCWYPEEDEDRIRATCIQNSSSQHGHSSAMLVPDKTAPKKSPPTYIKVNEFTAIFQVLVNTYGLPRYQEANPALFTIVTFPFLFGVMYGDIGHGLMLLSVGIYAVWKADELKFSIPVMHEGRYILLMMGLFAVYCGFLYNDFFSIGLTLFESRWTQPAISPETKAGSVVAMQPKFDHQNQGGPGPYPFGLDPAWHGAQNELVYLNSMKMKLAVVLGVAQMLVGLLLRFTNAMYEKNMVDFACECVPMFIFMICFFGFMDYMILYKWVTPMRDPPSIINSMIAMAMWSEDSNPMFGHIVPQMLMGICMLAVPWMLIPKPIILNRRNQAQLRPTQRFRASSDGLGGHMPLSDEESLLCEEEQEDEFDLTEVVIHQVIETIEYVLGTVSHTASYLRLWALSLAHQQLSLVFFGMTMLGGMSAPFPLNIFTTYFAFGAWFGVTVAILLGMDVMECFLHTLRLHWVEFQSKFYKADGYAFEPFCHRDVLHKKTDD